MSKNEILILDDDQEHLNWLIGAFSDYFKVKGFTNGEDLLREIERDIDDKYQVALIDLILEGQPFGGKQICREIKKN